jgi:4-carboxymuconolactone decarboxylase
MNNLSLKEISLVSLGASIGSNCIPCVVYHIKQCRNSGVTDEEIKTAIDAAVKVKDIPAANVLSTALRQLDLTDNLQACSGRQACRYC